MSEPIARIPPYRVTASVNILSEVLDYNHRLLNVVPKWRETMGGGVKILVLDTGLPDHVDLKPAGGKSFVPHYLKDENGHATHVGGIIHATANNAMGVAGIAPKAEVWYAAVLGADGSGDVGAIIRALEWAVEELRPDIITMSLGIDASVPDVPALWEATKRCYNVGIVVNCAAGNEAGDVGQPARYEHCNAVAAVNSASDHARFSNAGPQVDFAAGGVDVYSTYPINQYIKLSGTSMATPAFTGACALVISSHRLRGIKMTPDDVADHMRRISHDVGPEGVDELTGHGIPFLRPHETTEPEEPQPEPGPEPPQRDRPNPKKPRRRLCARLWSDFKGQVDAAIQQGEDVSDVLPGAVANMAEKIERGEG